MDLTNLLHTMASQNAPTADQAPAPTPGFFGKFMDLKNRDPLEVMGDPKASGMDKFMAFMMGSKFGVQSGNAGFGFEGPSYGSNGMLNELIKKMADQKKTKNPSLHTDASASLLLNRPMKQPALAGNLFGVDRYV